MSCSPVQTFRQENNYFKAGVTLLAITGVVLLIIAAAGARNGWPKPAQNLFAAAGITVLVGTALVLIRCQKYKEAVAFAKFPPEATLSAQAEYPLPARAYACIAGFCHSIWVALAAFFACKHSQPQKQQWTAPVFQQEQQQMRGLSREIDGAMQSLHAASVRHLDSLQAAENASPGGGLVYFASH